MRRRLVVLEEGDVRAVEESRSGRLERLVSAMQSDELIPGELNALIKLALKQGAVDQGRDNILCVNEIELGLD